MSAPTSAAGEGAGLATDSAGGDAVLFGGQEGGVLSSATQEYSETTGLWTPLVLTTHPSPRSFFAFAGDSSLQVAVLFGGVVNSSSLRVDNSTWVFSFSTGGWTNVTQFAAPARREGSAFAIDPAGGFGLLYGGWNQNYSATSTITYSDLWRLDLSTDAWSPVSVAGGPVPPPLQGASFSWDPSAGRFDLFGGCYPCSSAVWQFDPTSNVWSELATPSGALPAARAYASWTWDPSDFTDVLFGGTDGATRFNDTFEFFPLTDRWVQELPSTAPSPRFATASSWLNVSGNQTLLLSGGNASGSLVPDLWRLAPTSNLTLLVLNESSGLPVGGASVSVDGAVGLPTHGSGYLNLTELPAAETSVNVTCLGYAYSVSVFWLAPATPTTLEFGLTPVVPALVTVLVTNSTGVPLSNATVNVEVEGTVAPGSPQATDSIGAAVFMNVPSEIPVPVAVVTVSAPDYYSNSSSIAIPPDSQQNLLMTLIHYPTLDLEVLGVLSNSDVLPVHNASLSEDTHHLGLTNAAGWLNVTALVPGNVTLVATAPGFDAASKRVDLPRSGVVLVTFSLTGTPFGTLRVLVEEVASGIPVSGAIANLSSVLALSSVAIQVSGTTNRTGVTNLSVPQGSYDLQVTAYGYVPGSLNGIYILSNQTLDVAVYLTLLPGARVDILVHDAHTGAPLSFANVLVRGAPPAVSDAAGWANFTNVHFGETVITVSHSGYFNNTTQIFLTPGESLTRYLVNLTPGIPVVGNPPGGNSAFGGFPPSLGSLWPYLVAFAVTLIGATAYVFAIRSTRSNGAPARTPAISAPPAELGTEPISPAR